jgi:hypothetical protein
MPVIYLEPNQDETLNRHDFWRGCYATMLAELKREEILEFFAALPMEKGGRKIEGVEFFELLWTEKGLIPMDWNYGSTHPIEKFLIDRGYDAVAFFRKMLHRNNRATYMPGKTLFSWFYPVIDKFFDRFDPREIVLHLITVYTENYVEGTIHRRVKKVVDGEWMYSYMMFIGHKSFKKFYVFNFDFIVGEQFRAFPRMMDLPEFDDISLLADCQRIEDIIWSGTFSRDEKGLLMDGHLVSVPDGYHAFLDRNGCGYRKLGVPDWPVMVALEDIHCPIRKRRVIYKGCAYEAPSYITVIKHRKNTLDERRLLQHMLQDTVKEDELFPPEVIRRHEELVRCLERKAVFVYHASDESMTLNGEHLIKGIPAKILRNVLIGHLSDGRTEFEYRDFKRDFEISLGQKNSNFEVRFYRLIEKLEEKERGLRIVKGERGRFTLITTCKVVLQENHART